MAGPGNVVTPVGVVTADVTAGKVSAGVQLCMLLRCSGCGYAGEGEVLEQLAVAKPEHRLARLSVDSTRYTIGRVPP